MNAPRGLPPVLEQAAGAGVFEGVDLEVAGMVVRRAGLADPLAATAIALATKAVRLEHVCANFDAAGLAQLWVGNDGEVGPAPSSDELVRALRAAGPAVELAAEGVDVDEGGDAPVVLMGTRCYLRRYALLEQLVAHRLSQDTERALPAGVEAALAARSDRADPSQIDAVRRSLSARVSVIAGGPGTGKTTTVALLVGVARALDPPLRVALAAPTGKAAARLDEAVGGALGDDPSMAAQTLHRLLGVGRDGIARGTRLLEADVVVVDESSMVSLPLLAELLGRTRPDALVVLVGDPDQLASIEVGAVLSDVVAAAAARTSGVAISTLTTSHRFADAAGVAALADAVRGGSLADVDAAVQAHPRRLAMLEPDARRTAVVDAVVAHAESVIAAARSGDAAAALELVSSLGVLCATKHGDGSTRWWLREIERRLVERGVLRPRDVDYVGRPILVTRNDPLTGLTNGTVGVVVEGREGREAVFETGSFPVSAIASSETVWALTVHKSQGSEYDDVIVSLPGPDSPILTRELLYTAVTRARRGVTLIAPARTLDVALSRRVVRSSGLASRLAVLGGATG